jgi:hypothetical protein
MCLNAIAAQFSAMSQDLRDWSDKNHKNAGKGNRYLGSDSTRGHPTYMSEVLHLELSGSVPVPAHQSARRHMSEDCNPEAVRTSHLTI